MDIRQLVRGTVDWADLEAIALELAERADREQIRVEFLDADNWLSTPLVVDENWFVKVLTPQNAFVHAVFTGARNLGVFSRGTEGFFGRFAGPVEMGQHELEATRDIREIGLNAPEPLEVFEHEGHAVVVFEYLPDYRSLSDVEDEALEPLAVELFEALATMHDNGLAHGDLRGENVLVVDGDLFFIDATSVREAGLADATAYDLACALAVIAPRLGSARAVELALDVYDPETVLRASQFVDFVTLRPDHEFDATLLKGEIEKSTTM